MNRVETSGGLEQIEQLLSSGWKQRWKILSTHPDLIHSSVVQLCRPRDPLLAAAVRRAAAAGLDQAKAEVSWYRRFDREAADGTAAARTMVAELLEWATAEQTWLVDHARDVLRSSAVETAEAGQLHLDLLKHSAGLTRKDIEQVTALLSCSTPKLRDALRSSHFDLRRLALAADVVQAQDDAFPVPRRRSAADLAAVAERASELGVEPALHDLRLITRSRKARRHLDRNIGPGLKNLDLLVRRHHADPSHWLAAEAASLAVALVPAVPSDRPDRGDWLDLAATAVTDSLSDAPGSVRAEDVVSAVAWTEEALTLCVEDSDRAHCAGNLGHRIGLAVQVSAMPAEALLRSITAHRASLDLATPGTAIHRLRQTNLGARLSEAVFAGQLPADALRESLALQRSAAEDCPAEDPDRWMLLLNLSNALSEVINAGFLSAEALGEALDLAKAAAKATTTSSRRAHCLDTVATTIGESVRAGTMPSDRLAKALVLHRKAVAMTAESHPYWASRTSNLATRIAQAISAGELPAVQILDAIALQRLVLDRTRPGHPDRAGQLSNLASLIEEAIEYGVIDPADEQPLATEADNLSREALELVPAGHPHRPGRAANLVSRLARNGSPLELVEAIQWSEEAMAGCPPPHGDAQQYLANHASLLLDAIEAGVAPATDCAVAEKAARDALELTPAGHPARTSNLMTVAIVLGRHARLGTRPAAVLREAIDLLGEALRSGQHTAPAYYLAMVNFGVLVLQACQAAVMSYDEGATEMRQCVQFYANWTRRVVHSSTERARAAELGDAIVAGAALIINLGHGPEDAIAAVDQVRGAVARTRVAPPCPAGASAQQARAYEVVASSYDQTQRLLTAGIGDARDAERAGADLAAALEELDGTQTWSATTYLKPFAERLDDTDLVVHVIPGVEGLDGQALVLRSNHPAVAVPVPDFTEEAVVERVNRLLASSIHVPAIARWLGTTVCDAVLEHCPHARRWFVVPTGVASFLPFHAAGDPVGGWLDDCVTVQLIPHLTTLTRPAAPRATGRVVVAASTAGDIPLVAADAAIAAATLPQLSGTSAAARTTRSRRKTLAALREAQAVYFAGHGDHDLARGTTLGYDDGDVSIQDLERIPTRSRDLAIVSACWSAQISSALPDEVSGLPRPLLDCGFSGVAATLWPAVDEVAFLCMARFLTSLTADGPAAETLRETRRWLRTATRSQLEQFLVELLADDLGLTSKECKVVRKWLRRTDPTGIPCQSVERWGTFAYVGV